MKRFLLTIITFYAILFYPLSAQTSSIKQDNKELAALLDS